MKKIHKIIGSPAGGLLILALAFSFVVFNGCVWASETGEAAAGQVQGGQAGPENSVRQERPEKNAGLAAASLAGIQVSFKLDPGLMRGSYMGDRWVSPPTYTGAYGGKQAVIPARAHGLDANGSSREISAKWVPADPKMVTVSPGQGHEVRITVLRAGQSSLRVTFDEVSKELSLKAKRQNKILRVEISQ